MKGRAFKDVIKMGRTHLQDAVPITLGEEMDSYAVAVRRGIRCISLPLLLWKRLTWEAPPSAPGSMQNRNTSASFRKSFPG